MRLWHKALREVRSSAQLSLCIQQLQKSIAWERSIMKVVSDASFHCLSFSIKEVLLSSTVSNSFKDQFRADCTTTSLCVDETLLSFCLNSHYLLFDPLVIEIIIKT